MSDELKSQIAISNPPLRAEDISRRIYTIRGHRVMLEADLAGLYGVTTGALNQAMKRKAERFPEEFMFRLSVVAMLSGILQSHRAVQVNIAIMRANQ